MEKILHGGAGAATCTEKTNYNAFAEKMARGSKTAYGNIRFVLPRKRQMYIITSTKRM
jgi:hypothetical protein